MSPEDLKQRYERAEKALQVAAQALQGAGVLLGDTPMACSAELDRTACRVFDLLAQLQAAAK